MEYILKGYKGRRGSRKVLRDSYIIRYTALTLYLYRGLVKYLIFNIILILILIRPYINIKY